MRCGSQPNQTPRPSDVLDYCDLLEHTAKGIVDTLAAHQVHQVPPVPAAVQPRPPESRCTYYHSCGRRRFYSEFQEPLGTIPHFISAYLALACRWEEDYLELFAGAFPEIQDDRSEFSLSQPSFLPPFFVAVLALPVGRGVAGRAV